MQYNNILSTLCNIMDRLQDEESRTILRPELITCFLEAKKSTIK